MNNTLVVGASPNPDRYAYKAIIQLMQHGHSVVAMSDKKGVVNGVEFLPPFADVPPIDTITLYINPLRQKAYYDYFISLNPRRVIFNPGTENEELEALLTSNNIEVEEACTLVMLSIGKY